MSVSGGDLWRSNTDSPGEEADGKMLAVRRSPPLQQDNLECPQRFGKFLSSLSRGARAFPGNDLLGPGLRWARRGWGSKYTCGHCVETMQGGDCSMAPHVFPAEETASLESGHIPGKVLEQPRLFSKAMATFCCKLALQK